MKKFCFLVSIICILISCDKDTTDIDYTSFRSLNDSSLYTNLTPADDFNYFELRNSTCGDTSYRVIYSRGEKCSDTSDASICSQQWDSYYSQYGFFQSCLPSCCHYYFVSKINNQIQAYVNTESVISFLKPIDSPSDALMIAFTQGYSFKYNDSTAGGIKELGNKYQLIVLKMVSSCMPIQTNRYLLEINSEGDIKIVKEDVFEKSFDECI